VAEPYKIVLFYGFTPITDTNAVRLWQRDLCGGLGLTGRILVSPHGLNVTVGGPMTAVKRYVAKTREFPGLRDIDVKWSDGATGDFPRLSVKARDEIVSFGVPNELKIDHSGLIGGGTHLSPDQVHELVAARGDDVVFFDGRNEFESRIGRFRDAVIPPAETTHDFVALLDSGAYDHLKDRPIVTYCTGGVRCEILSVLMRNRGFSEVYQIEGGIVRYGQRFGNEGLWDGSLYVFDKRMHVDFAPDPAVLGRCATCADPTNDFHNCSDPGCTTLTLLCQACAPTRGVCNRCATKPAVTPPG
jgi:UPF0176 protein